MATRLRWAGDDDLTRFEPTLEQHIPKVAGSWGHLLDSAMAEVERRLKSRRDTNDVFEMGRVGLRSREGLKDVVAWFALHFAFVGADHQGADPGGFFGRKAAYYFQRASDAFSMEASALDYDLGNDGSITPDEEQRPFVARVRRG